MGILNSLGYVGIGDSSAQTRCYEFLKHAKELLDIEIQRLGGGSSEDDESNSRPQTPHTYEPPGSENPLQLYKNQRTLIKQELGLLLPNAGGHSVRKANMFWKNWDKIKEQTVRQVLELESGGKKVTRDVVFNKLGELEAGRSKD